MTLCATQGLASAGWPAHVVWAAARSAAVQHRAGAAKAGSAGRVHRTLSSSAGLCMLSGSAEQRRALLAECIAHSAAVQGFVCSTAVQGKGGLCWQSASHTQQQYRALYAQRQCRAKAGSAGWSAQVARAAARFPGAAGRREDGLCWQSACAAQAVGPMPQALSHKGSESIARCEGIIVTTAKPAQQPPCAKRRPTAQPTRVWGRSPNHICPSRPPSGTSLMPLSCLP